MTFKCEYCEREFDTKRGLKTHIGIKHPKGGKNTNCDYCGKEIHKPPSRMKKFEHHFCSPECHYKWLSKHPECYSHLPIPETREKASESLKEKSDSQNRKVEVECDYCGKKFYRVPSSISEHNFCSAECYHKWNRGENHPLYGKDRPEMEGRGNPNWKPKVTKVCEYCGKEFKVIPAKKDTARFCSKECMDKYFRGENHPMHGREGKENPMWKPKVTKTCEICGKTFEVIPSKKGARFCSKECQSKWLSKKRKGKNNPMYGKTGKENPFYGEHHSKEARQKMSKAKQEYLKKHPEARKRILKLLGNRPTKLEQKMIDIIKKNSLPFEYVGDGGSFIGELNPDFIHTNGVKKVIEVFGDYWHSGERVNDWRRTEFGRKAYLSQLGYDCLVIWGHEINQLPNEEIGKKIEDFLSEGRK